MTSLPGTSRKVGLVFCAAIAAFLPSAFASHSDGGRAETVVGVQPGRYIVAGQTHVGVDALHSAVRSANPGSVRIVACSPAATASWLAAVKRLDDLPMHLDVVDVSSPACAEGNAANARQDAVDKHVDPAVQRYWTARQP